jgi:hypothetical protein
MRAALDDFDPDGVSATVERGARVPGIAHACRRVLVLGWLALMPVFLGLYIVESIRNGHAAWAIDFNGNFRLPAQEILHGTSPYHPEELVRVRAAVAAGHSPIEYQHGVFPSYPAPALLLGVLFSALPLVPAAWLWFGCLLAAGWLALRLVGVRDWRVYAATAMAPPVISSLFYGAVDLVLMLGLAACWRWRDQAGKAGIALGAIIALKLVALPLVVWFAATRRWRAAGVSLAVAALLAAVGWAVIGFDGLAGYPHLLSLLTDVESTRGYSVVAFAGALGAGASMAALMPYAAGTCLLAALWVVSRRGPSGDAITFLLGVLAALAFSPIVWQHSLALLLVPLAALRPRFDAVWTLPVLLWSTPDTSGIVHPLQLMMCALVVGIVVARALASQSPARRSGALQRSSGSVRLA